MTRPELPDLDLLRPIGAGGFGEVWLATNRTTGRLYAVKLLQGSPLAGAAGREAEALMRLEAVGGCRHPHVMEIHHVGRTPECLYYLMDPADDVSGEAASLRPEYRPATLKHRLDAGPLPAGACWEYARQLLAALACLHQAGMVHRDVKPSNCLFVGDALKLADFGLVTEAHRQVSRLGTEAYMPPDGRMDTRADVYAAGLVIYEMLTGLSCRAFPRLGPRAAEVVADRRLARLNRLVLQACQPAPAERFADAREMLRALESSDLVPVLPVPIRRRWALLLGGAALGLLVVAGLLWHRSAPTVDVNFITEPFEATVRLDGIVLRDAAGQPYRTPCSVVALPARSHRLVFEHEGLSALDAGMIDLAETQEIVARWPSSP